MLKITIQNQSDVMTLKLEGKLVGPWVKELENCWNSTISAQSVHPVKVDLSSVNFIDGGGKDLLKTMYRQGAELLTAGCLNRCIVEAIIQSEKKKE